MAYKSAELIGLAIPGENGQLRLDDLHPDDDQQQGADDEHDELQQRLQQGQGEAVLALDDVAERLQEQRQRELRGRRRRVNKPAEHLSADSTGLDDLLWMGVACAGATCRAALCLAYPLCDKDLVDAADAHHRDALLLAQGRRSHQDHRRRNGGPH